MNGLHNISMLDETYLPVADLGGGGADTSLSGIRPPADPKGPPLYYFEITSFG